MAAAKTPRNSRPSRASSRGKPIATAETTTSRAREERAQEKPPRAAKQARGTTSRPRGRPRVSNTATDRVTLRVENESLQVIDTLVKLKQYSNRSDAIRHAIKVFCDTQLENVEEMVAKQEKRQKLLRLAALSDELNELSET